MARKSSTSKVEVKKCAVNHPYHIKGMHLDDLACVINNNADVLASLIAKVEKLEQKD